MTLQLVINYLSFTKITHQKITIISNIWRLKEMIIVNQNDSQNVQWEDHGEFCEYLLQQVFDIANNKGI